MPEFYGYVRKILALVAYFGATARIIHEKRSCVAVGDRNSTRSGSTQTLARRPRIKYTAQSIHPKRLRSLALGKALAIALAE
ncbi:hypothetical protein [uncultured Campylobacter sp.]|uniref:hypothetical protein n=1 Tax=uncultured Campylobacter sp. TaxID=218934 RepID=UPI002602B768|nr:hypothetical protein [uncultured Campylobacter sp.]